jgi:hypothetical protein
MLSEIKAPVIGKVVMENRKGLDGIERLHVKGVMSSINRRNENNRRYSRQVWENNLAEGSTLRRRMASRQTLGELEHPESGMTHLARVSHVVLDATIETLAEGNPYGVPAGEWVVGETLIFNNQNGKILQEFYACGVVVGMSSRGRGDVTQADDGVDEVAENYECEVWDFVANPSVTEAFPLPVHESIGTDIKTHLSDLIAKATPLLEKAKTDLTKMGRIGLIELGSTLSLLAEQIRKLQSKELNETKSTNLLLIRESVEKVIKQLRADDRVGEAAGQAPSSTIQQRRTQPRKERTVATKMNEKAASQVIVELSERLVRAEARTGQADPKALAELRLLRRRYTKLAEGADILLKRSRQHRAAFLKEQGLLKKAIALGEDLRQDFNKLQQENTKLKSGKVVESATQPPKPTKRQSLVEAAKARVAKRIQERRVAKTTPKPAGTTSAASQPATPPPTAVESATPKVVRTLDPSAGNKGQVRVEESQPVSFIGQVANMCDGKL